MSEVTKRKKGQVVNNNERQLILNFFSYFKNENPEKSVSEVVREISKATGCSERTIYKIKKEGSKGIKTTVKKSRFRKKENKNSRNLKYDSFIKSSIRQKVYYNFSQNIPPTLNIILSQINNDEELPNFRRSTLHTLLKEIGFVYEQKGKKLLLSEKSDLVKSRKEYLNDIQQFRNDNRFIIYTGGTVLNLISSDKNVTKQKVDSCRSDLILTTTDLVPGRTILYTIDNSFFPNDQNLEGEIINVQLAESIEGEQSRVEESRCDKNVDEKQLQLVVMHAVSSEGFIEGGECILNKNREDSDMYEYWFSEKILPKIPQNSVVVIDSNAPFFKADETVPDSSWKKEQIKNWLLTRNISVGEMNKKKELLDIVSNIRPLHSTKYKLEELAKEKAVTVINLPLFHYELNPLNMVWAHVKTYVKSNMKNLKFGKIKKLVKDGFCTFSQSNWTDCLDNVKKIEQLLWSLN